MASSRAARKRNSRKKSSKKNRRRVNKRRVGPLGRIRNYFFAGILVTAPVAITIWLSWKMVTFVDDSFRPLIPSQWNPESYLPFALPGIGILIVLLGLTAIGFFTTGYFGKVIVKFSERLLSQVPIVSSIYGWTRQVLETMLSQESTAFREVVLVEYPCRGTWAVGFITGQTKGEVQNLTDETVFNVFIPATPNPTTGFLLFIPERDIQRLDINVEDGIKLVISGGIVKPPKRNGALSGTKTLAAPIGERIREQGFEEALKAGKESVEHEPKKIAPKPAGILGRLRIYLFTGILITAPVAITIWLAYSFVNLVDNEITPFIPLKWNPESYLPFGLPGLGLVIAFVGFTLIGFFTAGFVGRSLLRTGERVLGALPIVRGIYSAMKQIFETIFKDQSKAFREVVLIEYPRPESWAIGFLTGDAADQIQENTPRNALNIFLPTTPNPTSGFLLFLPRNKTRKLSMTVEQGLKMVVSGGIVTPDEEAKDQTGRSTPGRSTSGRSTPGRSTSGRSTSGRGQKRA